MKCKKCKCEVNLAKARRRYLKRVADRHKPIDGAYECHCGEMILLDEEGK